jgi:hypothetical protein
MTASTSSGPAQDDACRCENHLQHELPCPFRWEHLKGYLDRFQSTRLPEIWRSVSYYGLVPTMLANEMVRRLIYLREQEDRGGSF